MNDQDDLESPAEEDEESLGGSNAGLESDDDVGEAYKEAIGHEPDGSTLAEEVEAAEKSRRGIPAHEEEK